MCGRSRYTQDGNLIYSYTTGINNKRLPLISDAFVYRFPCSGKFINFSVFQKEIKHGELERLNVVYRRDCFETL